MDKVKSKIICLAFAITFSFSGEIFASPKSNSLEEFHKRFGDALIYDCKKNSDSKFITFNVDYAKHDSPTYGSTQKYNDIPKIILPSEEDDFLYLTLFRGENTFLFTSWGPPQFDQSMKFMSIKLNNGKMLVFERFRKLPAPNLDGIEKHFDSKPFFYLTIDKGPKLACGQDWNNGAI